MIKRVLSNSRGHGFALLAVIALGLLPAAAEAGGLAFRNDTDNPVFVQGVAIIKGVARRGKLHALRPGQVSREPILLPGPVPLLIRVRVYDGNQPARILCEENIPFTGTDLFFAVQAEEPEKSREGEKATAKEKERKPVPPKVKLMLVRPPPPVSPPPNPRR